MSFLSDFVGKVTNSVEYLTDGSFTVPENVNYVFITAQGGGSSGNAYAETSVTSDTTERGGASGRLVVRAPIQVNPGDVVPVTVGQGGDSVTATVSVAADSDSAQGNPGGSSSFGTLVSVVGGSMQLGGVGAATSGEDLSYPSSHGTDLAVRHTAGSTDTDVGGTYDEDAEGGGAGYWGDGGDGGADGVDGQDAPTNSGAGGGGAVHSDEGTSAVSATSGAGGDGRVIVEW